MVEVVVEKEQEEDLGLKPLPVFLGMELQLVGGVILWRSWPRHAYSVDL